MDEITTRRNYPILTMAIAIKLTGLTARQIRYYTDKELIKVARTPGGQRLFSLNQIDLLLEIKAQISAGFSLAETKKFLSKKMSHPSQNDDQTTRKILFDELLQSSPFGNKS
ncbi:hypothetical protein FC62_GL000021 [Amylolactobacillus amylotrophicus DSM 20534]|uniref:Uncharacterized protein n=3 Tax=Amylolactobacillus TaxID=2767876 RepID=A0A0R1YLK1_9LACO|nr:MULTISPECIES: MerR family transcriptional regulator [Amylolactobacillus]APT17950.1 hypothetical protein LA20533_00815 [Amylolactobacillus amylophilus DSM 20533 = JCM 1125]KRK38339.1 hypothetical protein FC62_GL000021 [Amylolactobacillus amylotrophicus DSM 20534]KRM43018.1 hypothetical protein FD40_GL000818 [Amylolactobacillus amylophilus DSM 20533 = JCM 1125]GED79887.1 MerR family transcriptional regulator [Amylolactobacillus amylophilus]